MFTLVRDRLHVVITRLDDTELKDFNYLLDSLDMGWCSNKSEAFRKVLRMSAELLRERRIEEGRRRLFDNFQPPKINRGSSSIEVEGESEIADFEDSLSSMTLTISSSIDEIDLSSTSRISSDTDLIFLTSELLFQFFNTF